MTERGTLQLREDAMTLSRRFIALAGVFALACGPAAAQNTDAAKDFPNRSIKIVVPFPAGGPSDVLARADRPEDERGLGPAGGDREPPRRQHGDRRAARQGGRARWLHDADGDQLDADHEPVPLPHAAVRSDQRLRAGHLGRQDHAAPDGQFGERGEDDQRPDRQGEGSVPASSTSARAPSPPGSRASCSTRPPACRPCWCPTTAAPR